MKMRLGNGNAGRKEKQGKTQIDDAGQIGTMSQNNICARIIYQFMRKKFLDELDLSMRHGMDRKQYTDITRRRRL